MGRLITSAGAELASLPDDQRPGTIIVAVMTDGYENASQEWTHPAIKALVEQQTKDYAWQFLYMGADQDAIEVGVSLGVSAAASVTYGRGKTKEAMAMSSQKMAKLRSVARRPRRLRVGRPRPDDGGLHGRGAGRARRVTLPRAGRGLLRGHPDAAVDADDLAVHVGVGQALDHHRRELVAGAEALGEEHVLAEVGLERLRRLALAVDRGVDQAGGDRC